MTPDLGLCWRAYLHRFDIEHAIKFQKSVLGWVTPALRHPEQAGRWTAVILAASAQLVLTRPLATHQRLPSGRPPPPARLPPGRVRAAFCRVPALFPPVATPKKSCPAGPGRPTASTSGPAQRYPVIKKAA